MKKKSLTYQKRSGFKTPDNYFEDFTVDFSKENRFTGSIESEQITSGHKVPENYFDEFKVPLPQEKESKVIPIFDRRLIASIASVAAVFIFIILIVKKPEIHGVADTNLDKLSIENYLDNNDIDFEIQDINYSFDDNSEEINSELNHIDKEAILDYLTENTEVITLINE